MSNKSQKASAPAPTMADLIDNLMRIEMLTATGEGLDPATTIDVHLLAGIGRAVADDAAWYAPATAWQPIETAPHEELVVLAWFEGDVWKQEIALASAGERFPNGYSNRWIHGRATHWMPLPAPPVDSSAAPSTPVDTISADPVGKEGK